jgi:hypothetical protein
MKSATKAVRKPFFIRIKHSTVVEIVSALFILLFVYTGINKLLSIGELQTSLSKYPLIGGFSVAVAWGLPIVELIVAALLVIPKTKLIGLYSSGIMMTGFTLYILYLFAFAPGMPCTCGGMLKELTWTEHLIFNTSFIFLAIMGIRSYRLQYRRQLDEDHTPPPIIFT